METSIEIRPGRRADLPALTAIYNYYVINTPITFDIEPHTAEKRQPWFDQFKENTRHQLLVAASDETPVGYASSGPVRPKRAYETSIEMSVYLDQRHVGRGLGTRLYESLFASLQGQDIHRCYGIITLPNEASIALHERFGFVKVSHLSEVGRKFGKYWDTVWLERPFLAKTSPHDQ